MVAVGSKSIPEKQSISLNLSKDSEDKLEDDLFSDIFSSQSLTSVEIKDSSSKINEHDPTFFYPVDISFFWIQKRDNWPG